MKDAATSPATTIERPSALRRNLLLVASYVAVLLLIARVYA